MSQYTVFREGTSWRYSFQGIISPERFETRDDAQFAAESAAVQALKEEDKSRKKAKDFQEPILEETPQEEEVSFD